MLKAVFMDFDGLVLDTELLWYKLYKKWFEMHYSIEMNLDDFLVCVGSEAEDLLKFMDDKHDISVDREVVFNETLALFHAESDKLFPREGVLKFIEKVKAENLKLVLVTSSHYEKVSPHLERLGLFEEFDHIITADDVENKKPHPDLYLKALEDTSINNTEALIVEDSLNGLIAGNRAGINVIICPNKVTENSNFEHYFDRVSSLNDIDLRSLID